MHRIPSVLFVVALLCATALADDKEDEAKKEEKESQFKTQQEKVSYAIGLNIGRSIAEDDLELNLDLLFAGLKDGVADKPKMTDEEMQQVMIAFQQELQERAEAKQKASADKAKKDGADFLAANGKKDGVKTLASGLQYKVIKAGEGARPKASDTVKTNYRGTLLDGTEFDSSYGRGMPATFRVEGVIPGWTEALQLMKVGAKWTLYIPSELAYGVQGTRTGSIGPNQTLIFEIELLAIEK